MEAYKISHGLQQEEATWCLPDALDCNFCQPQETCLALVDYKSFNSKHLETAGLEWKFPFEQERAFSNGKSLSIRKKVFCQKELSHFMEGNIWTQLTVDSFNSKGDIAISFLKTSIRIHYILQITVKLKNI